MSTTNGKLTPPPSQLGATGSSSPQPTAKRKRVDSGNKTLTNGGSKVNGTNGWPSLMEDVHTLLKERDPYPSVLNHPLPEVEPPDEPNPKRAKLSNGTSASTIATKLRKSTYQSLDDVLKDIDLVCNDLLEPIRAKDTPQNGMSGLRSQALSQEDIETSANILGFQKSMTLLLQRHAQQKPADAKHAETNGDSNATIKAEGDAKVEDDDTDLVSIPEAGATVLTLYGNASGPKQLFSSLQRSAHAMRKNLTSKLEAASEVSIPLREGALPNIISTTKIVPVQVDHPPTGKRRGPTLGDTFRAPANLRALDPPKPPRQTVTRGSTVSWQSRETLPKSTSKTYYPSQSLRAGEWLDYTGVSPSQDAPSPSAKRKQRDRALSTGEASAEKPSEETLAIKQQAREEALFNSAFSSFAPDKDDTGVIVPQATRNQMWWQKVGSKYQLEPVTVDPALLEMDVDIADGFGEMDATEEEDQFRKAVETFDPEEQKASTPAGETSQQAKETAEVLSEISGLLETLASYQRIRNSTVAPPTTGSGVGQNTPLAELIGTPTTPSGPEIDTYQILKSQLQIMISALPPYAVAKLDGDQLNELNIDRKILVDGKDIRGVMEEDQLSRLAKATALTAAAGGAPNVRNLAAAPTPRPSSNSQSAVRHGQPVGSYYPQQQAPGRPPAMPLPRASSNLTQSYRTPNPAPVSNHRPTPPTQHSYNQNTPRAQYTPNVQSYQQRSSHGAYPSNQGYGQQTPQIQPYHKSYAQQSQPSYPNQTPSRPQLYNNNAISYDYNRKISPQKPQSYSQDQYSTPRPSYPNQLPPNASNMPNQQYPQRQYPTAAHSPSPFTPQPQPQLQPSPQPQLQAQQSPAPVGPTGFHTSMTTEQQQNMLDRSRAEFAARAKQAKLAPTPPGGMPAGTIGMSGSGTGSSQVNGLTNGQGMSGYEGGAVNGPQGKEQAQAQSGTTMVV